MTKARQAKTEHVLRAVARLHSQARLNAGDAAARGRTEEAHAWQVVADHLEALAELVSARDGVPVQQKLFGGRKG